jgi:carbamoyltransferase
MSRTVLGVHNGHNASAAIVRDGSLAFAMQEERLTRTKNQGGMPSQVLREISNKFLGLEASPAAIPIACGGRNLTTCHWRRDDILRSYGQTSCGPLGRVKRLARKNATISDSVNKMKMKKIASELKVMLETPHLTAAGFDHHLCHAAAAYFGWGRMNEKILILTCDGAGDCACATVNVGENGEIKTIAKTEESNSIGALYGKVTYLFGMVPMEHEYKLMGLAPYAENSREARAIAAELEQLFEFDPQNPMVWRRRNGCPPLQFSSDYLSNLLRRRRFDHVAGGVQLFVEKFLARWVQSCVRATGIRRVALSGGVFMNVKANQKILELAEVDELFVFPSCGDETNAMGAAWLLYRQLFGEIPKPLSHFYLGSDYTNGQVEDALRGYKFQSAIRAQEEQDVERAVASLLSRGKIVARFKGRGEFGARALGNRSILANAAQTGAVRTINEMIKCRDFWMPFAPSVLEERSEDYFVKPKPMPAPYMIMTFDTREQNRQAISAALHPYDHTGRPQEVSENTNPDYYRLLKHFEGMTGEGLILNTSFNLHGEPVVCSPEDALRVFDLSGLDYLALENILISKTRRAVTNGGAANRELSHAL